jgi:gamma-glutamyltranspeptidase
MLSSMTPTIIAKDGKLVAVVGSPGGRTIINTVLQVVLNLADGWMGIQDAVNAPRFSSPVAAGYRLGGKERSSAIYRRCVRGDGLQDPSWRRARDGALDSR